MDFFETLVRFEIDLWNAVDAGLQRDGRVTVSVLSALRVVAAHPGTCRVQELRDDLRITGGAASKLADRLERDGFVVRVANPGDRRSSLLVLTDTGADAERTGSARMRALVRELVGDDLDDVTASLAALRERLQAAVR